MLEYGIQRTRRHIQTGLARDRNGSRLARMLVLPMAAARPRQAPSVVCKQTKQFPDLHALVSIILGSV